MEHVNLEIKTKKANNNSSKFLHFSQFEKGIFRKTGMEARKCVCGRRRRRFKKSLKYWIQNTREIQLYIRTAVYQEHHEIEGPTDAVANNTLEIMENCQTEQSN